MPAQLSALNRALGGIARGLRRIRIKQMPALRYAFAFIAGVLTVGGFAPFRLFPLPVMTIALLIALWQRAPDKRAAFFTGFAFGMGFFLAGVSWVYVSMHDIGGMPALVALLVTVLFCAVLALYPALTGLLYFLLGARSLWATLFAMPALWTLAEWLRGTLFTGFPWIELGYSQVPDSALAGYVPVAGIHAATLLTAFTAACLVAIWRLPTVRGRAFCAIALLVVWGGGGLLKYTAWSFPIGAPLKVALLQGNIPQSMKWDAAEAQHTLDTYATLVAQSHAQLIVLPETALPVFLDQMPAYLGALADAARAQHGDVLVGAPETDAANHYYNSMVSFGASPSQTYRKEHLVPFGEFVPYGFHWFTEMMNIPLGDFSRGDNPQPLAIAGQKIAVNICYEDAFGAEIIRQLPQATLLVNASNVAWFGRSIAPMQHLQMSQARALETGRYVLRATNTGMTAIINPHGVVESAAPEFVTARLSGTVRGYLGATPYVRWGDAPTLVLCLALLLIGGRDKWLALVKSRA